MAGFPVHYPTGGDNIVFTLSSGLAKKGYKVCILSIRNIERYLGSRLKIPENIMSTTKKSMLRSKIYKILSNPNPVAFNIILPLVRKYYKIDYDYSILRDIDVLFVKATNSIQIDSKIIIATWWGTSYYVNDLKVDRESKYYLIQNEEDAESFSGKLSFFAEKSYELPLKKIVINNYLASRFHDSKPLKLRIGFDSEFFKCSNRINTYKNVSLIFYLSTKEYKGGIYGLQAITKLHEVDPTIHIVTFGNMKPESIPEFVEHHFQPRKREIRELLCASKIFVFPSIVEGFGLLLLEAMSCGCTIIAARNHGSEEIVKDGFNGILTKPRDSEDLFLRILDIVHNEDEIERLSKAGQETAEKFTYAEMLSSFTELFK
jgi:glycosyltransferase involved in cell wall biosynthesis